MTSIPAYLYLAILLFPISAFSQSPALTLKKEFNAAENDTAFAAKHGDEPYRVFSIVSPDNYRDSLLLNSSPGTVIILKRKTDDALVYYKITQQKMDTIMRASEIYLPEDLVKNPEQLADSLLKLLENGASFEELARQYGRDGTASSGGDLGWVKKGRLVQEFEDAVLNHKPGEYYKVFTEKFGWYVATTTGLKIEPSEVKVIEMVKKL